MDIDPAAPVAAVPSPNDGASIRERHPSYYFEMAVFEVDGTLFRVPKDGFIALDPGFFDRFKGLGNDQPGEETPFEIKDTTAEAFHGLLLVLYPFRRTAETYGEWLGALDLATKWSLNDIRTKAIATLTTLHETSATSQIEIALLAKRYRVKQWLRNAYAKLVQQEELSIESLHHGEDNILDWETIARLFSVRTKLSSWPSTTPRPICYSCSSGYGVCQFGCRSAGSQITLERILGEVDILFRGEFKNMDIDTKTLNHVDTLFDTLSEEDDLFSSPPPPTSAGGKKKKKGMK
ncbi:hypothetical protein CPB83DRAFT_910379 [Crepidotus variabilis]|uniref:BTB domain-containing protein n=1 Tax=Crepidotus variabilis TaxID=179855 RepID=A0A9P6E7D1_9AGAR|nr:hypothetical protein CPB83DRAFT_910379 [Crepidotus variabilis]